MYVSTKGFVLRCYPFKDNKIIARIYTKDDGLVSFIVKKTKSQTILSQPLTIANIVYKKTKSSSMFYVKETSLNYIYKSIPYDIKKLNYSLVLSEILNKCAKETNEILYDFIVDSFKWVDNKKTYPCGFDTLFLIKFCELLGISPFNAEIKHDQNLQLNLKEGVFIKYAGFIKKNELVPKKESYELLKLASQNYDELEENRISEIENKKLFNYLLLYISNQMVDVTNLKSIKILKEITA